MRHVAFGPSSGRTDGYKEFIAPQVQPDINSATLKFTDVNSATPSLSFHLTFI